MEEFKHDHPLSPPPPFPWWSDSHNRPPLQSPWLQSILSDLDEKIKTIVNLIQDDGDSFTERAEMFYKRRPEILKILHDLHDSYRCVAQKYDQLRTPSSTISLQKLVKISTDTDHNNKLQESVPEEIDYQTSPTMLLSKNNLKKAEHDGNMDINEVVNNGSERGTANYHLQADGDGKEEERIWSGLRLSVTKLIEDNRRQQAELIRRNDEKREVIKQLRAQITRLMDENRALMSCLPYSYNYKVDNLKPSTESSNSNNLSKLKGLNCIGKFH